MKQKWSFFDIMMYRIFGKRKVRLSSQSANIKTWKQLNDVFGCLNSKGTGQLIAIREIMKYEDYINLLDENLQLSVQNLDLGQWFTFSKIMIPNICLNQWLCGFEKRRLQFCNSLQWVLTWIQLKIYGKNWKFK